MEQGRNNAEYMQSKNFRGKRTKVGLDLKKPDLSRMPRVESAVTCKVASLYLWNFIVWQMKFNRFSNLNGSH